MKNEKPEFSLEDLNQKIVVQDEVMTLAKENSPRLLNKFRLVYPDFFNKLSAIQPNLKNSELIFCIYLKLNLTTKEIATYTFVTPKAIQNRKNRLRKKLNIPSELDIYKWFNDL
ncbi:helix-turn-helix transcriptional regulator [Chryseobacterium sp. MMS23-Vi53]|uniref:helix-turn-helix transcriptional regulator n=1 Tax=Chryseobacterium sp. MMS23-Vi53 TaxID=3386644 RepID=UPI0039ECE2D5